jgi:hypothetical protein
MTISIESFPDIGTKGSQWFGGTMPVQVEQQFHRLIQHSQLKPV